jgi:repressor LexA
VYILPDYLRVKMKELTTRQKQILRFMADFLGRHGRVPNAPEIARHFGFRHHSTAYEHLKSLAKKGYLSVSVPPYQKSAVTRFSAKSQSLFSLAWSVVGRIPAGPAFPSDELVEGVIRSVEDLIPGIQKGDFFLRVEGDSMIGKGISPGQLVLLRPNESPRTGDIAAVWVDGEGTTLKELAFSGSLIRLIPANPKYLASEHSRHDVVIQGVVVAGIDIHPFRK